MRRQATLIALIGIILALTSGQVAGQKKPADKPGVGKSEALSALLGESIDMGNLAGNDVSLKDLVAYLQGKLVAVDRDFAIFVDTQAFAEENPDAEKIEDTVVPVPGFPKKQKLAMVLRTALRRVRTNNATFLLRGGAIEITTMDRAKPENLLGYPITARFSKRPLDEAIDELSDLSGATIIIDSRVGDKAKTPVSASFKNTITLEGAVRLLAEMADLQTDIRDNILFITGKAKAEAEADKSEIHFHGRRLDLALRDLARWSGANIVLDPRYLPPPTPINPGRQKRIEAAAGLQQNQLETIALQVGGFGLGGMPFDPLEEPRNMKVTASFKRNVSAEVATRILANQVHLSVAVLGNVLYVTDPTNADRLLKEKAGKFPSGGFFLPGLGN